MGTMTTGKFEVWNENN